ncbi:MAG: M24 family metallopeptidase, partial [Patescibacteria group bacterium]
MIASRARERAALREGGKRLAQILGKIIAEVRPGVSTLELDRLAEKLIVSAGGEPAFKGYRTHAGERPFPASICTSRNDEVVHAIPRADMILNGGDILGLDIGMCWPLKIQNPGVGLITDMAVTVAVGK